MAHELTFVTGNPGKVAELTRLVEPLGWTVRQDDRGYPEIQGDSLAEVAHAGAEHLRADGLELPFLLEDAGLFVAALRGFPGVYSRHALDTLGCQGLLRLMQDVERESRTAAFRAHLCYVDEAGIHDFEGTVRGHIAEQTRGDGGFGFDPVFVPEGEGRTFSEMSGPEKDGISHRGRAARAFVDWLSNQ